MFFSKAYSAAFDIQEDMAKAVQEMRREFAWFDPDFTLVMVFATTFSLSLLHDRLKPNDGAKLYFRLDQLVAKHAPEGRLAGPAMADLRMRAAQAIAVAADDESAAEAYYSAAREFSGVILRDEFMRVGPKLCAAIRRALQHRGLLA